MDGVLCELVEVHRDSFNDALAEVCDYKVVGNEFWKYYNGLPTRTKLAMLVNRGIIHPNDVEKVWSYKQDKTFIRIETNLSIDEQKIELHKFLKKKGYLLACVSNSIIKTINLALKVTGQLEYMDLVLGNEIFKDKPKPNPYCYTLAMNKLNLEKNETLIVEDSEKGIISARMSGANVLEVADPTEVTIENVINKIDSLDKRSV